MAAWRVRGSEEEALGLSWRLIKPRFSTATHTLASTHREPVCDSESDFLELDSGVCIQAQVHEAASHSSGQQRGITARMQPGCLSDSQTAGGEVEIQEKGCQALTLPMWGN